MRSRALPAAFAVMLVASAASAQTANDKASAEVLFQQGKALLADNKLAEACPKLAESLRLDTGIGTMLYLAECYERSGKTASAWAQFREAYSVAQRDHDPREKIAKDRADKLEPKLARLVIVVPKESEAPDLAITRDDSPIGRAGWGIETPIDPGAHVVRATATDRKPLELRITIGGDGVHERVSVPPLEIVKHEAAAPITMPPAEAPKSSSQKTIGIGLVALGAVGIGVGSFFGLKAISTLDDANAHCDSKVCDQQGLDGRADSRSQATVSTVAFAVGGVALAAGIVLWLTAPKSPKTATIQGALIRF